MRQIVSRLRAICNVADPPFLRFGTRSSIAFLLVGCLLIVAWQAEFIEAGRATSRFPVPKNPPSQNWLGQLDRTYESTGFVGFHLMHFQKYFYFFFYTGKFPVTTAHSLDRLAWNRHSAWRALGVRDPAAEYDAGWRPRADRKLMMEEFTALNTGDYARIFLLYPDAWIEGSAKRATLFWFNRLLGIASLLGVFVSFSLLNHRLFGSVLVVVLGSHPFQLVELYARSNVFGYPIAVASLMLALHAPLILGRWRHGSVYVLPVVAGVVLASVREIRAEPALVLLSVAATYLLIAVSWRRRAALVSLLVLSSLLTTAAWGRYWEAKFDEARSILSAQDGRTSGEWNRHHPLWHSIWCGLGDFGQDHGYEWADTSAFQYGLARANERFGTNFQYRIGHRYFQRDPSGPAVRPEASAEYAVVMRDKVLGDIWADPLWYSSVIAKRLKRLFSSPTPIRLGLGTRYVDVPWTAWLFIPVLGWVVFLRCWDQFLLLGFYGCTSLTTIAVFSGSSMPYNSAFHNVLFAVVVCWVVHGLLEFSPARRSVT